MSASRSTRVAERFLTRLAYDEGERSPYGYDPGSVGPFVPTVGQGSQVPFPRDHQGKPVAPPDLGLLEIPGYEWHDTSKAFHQVMSKSAASTGLHQAADIITRANDMLGDAVELLNGRNRGPSLADDYPEAIKVVRTLEDATRELERAAGVLRHAGRGRTASHGIDLAREMRTLRDNMHQHQVRENHEVLSMVISEFMDNQFDVVRAKIEGDRGWLNVVGEIIDEAPDTWRSRAEVEALFDKMFNVDGQISGAAPRWKFSMGGFQGHGLTASLKAASYDSGIYKLMERAHAEIKEAYPEVADEHILKVVGPWFAGTLFSDKIPKSRFAPDGGKKLLRILNSLH